MSFEPDDDQQELVSLVRGVLSQRADAAATRRALQSDERYDTALWQLLCEELGIAVRDPRPVPITISDPTLDMLAFLVTRWDGEPVNAAPDEHDELRWFGPDDLAAVQLAHPESLANIISAIEVAHPGGALTANRDHG